MGCLYKWVKVWWRQHSNVLASQVRLTLADITNKSVSLKMQYWVKSSATFSGFASKLLQTATSIPSPVSSKSPGVKFQGKQKQQIPIQSQAWCSKRKITLLWCHDFLNLTFEKRSREPIIYFGVTENFLEVQPCIKCHSATSEPGTVHWLLSTRDHRKNQFVPTPQAWERLPFTRSGYSGSHSTWPWTLTDISSGNQWYSQKESKEYHKGLQCGAVGMLER